MKKIFNLAICVLALMFASCEEEAPATSRKVETGKVSEIRLTSATFHGIVNVDISQYNTVTFGIMLSESKAELNERGGEMFKAKALIGKDFELQINNLSSETKYYYCAWLFLNGTQYEFGDIKEFETLAPSPATVITNPITKIMTNSAVAGGCVKDDGGASVTERGVVYSTSKEPTTSNYKVKSGSGVGEFTCNLTNLQDNAIYYVRAYAINSKGTVYGEERYFTTKEITLPSVYTSNVTDIAYTSASIRGNVTNDGNAEVTERGIVYSTTLNPTTSNTKKRNGSGTGSFTCNLTDLQDGVTYYVRAYATNLKGTAYGEEKSFTTKTINLPTVSTLAASDISFTSATVGGNVSDDGGGNVNERGIVYSTSKEPTTSNNKVKNGSGNGSFSCDLTGLQDGVTYYVRAYATNLKGIAYGEEKSFTTKTINLPTVSTTTASNISYTSATVGGNISNDGGANVTERGIVYSTLKEPTISNNKVKNGSGNGSFSCDLSNLQDGVTYYVRAYAINLKGTAYGAEISFSTPKRLFENGYEYIDLGLSVKWATCNVGASRLEDYGDYFAWGETEPKSTYSWSTYKWCRGSEDTQTKYCTSSSYGTVDNKKTLELSDDVARANWGGSWRMPTKAELDELLENCSWEWTSQNGVYGRKVTGPNGNSIFLPAAGSCYDSSLRYAGSGGHYWSSSLYTDDPSWAYSLDFYSYDLYRASGGRCCGRSVRPVCQ